VHWDGYSLGEWIEELEGATALVNLAGRQVGCRHTAANRREIIQSRVNSVRVLDAALQRCIAPPTIWVQNASLAIYGDSGDVICTEDSPHGEGFCVEVCHAWEGAIARVRSNVRMPILRTGFVLGAGGQALKVPVKLVRAYLGGSVGTGRQYISWIHIADYCRAVQWVVANENADGVYNVTSPYPVTNRDFNIALRRVLGRPWSPRLPTPVVKLGAPLLDTTWYLATNGRRALPIRLSREGFLFEWTDLEAALGDVLKACA
jgi:uncharacterized protein (TIGR01777 family)